ncbi:sensor histidine kinase [Halocella sp. SP3-1]|uniref:sensor histidine kinase n=1 Tax=Halocella sp. SP3-1 TaxID=2382161 RepID=UPI000F75773E|nr:sensor histidine kinase [Halocella sp. SP3-1]AZO96250.1 sensor histidine kinase [Halocella sp. SP3-1]
MGKYSNLLNDVKVKYKLIFIYIVCVVAPIIVINLIFYNNMVANVKEINKNYYRLSTQRIVTKIENDFDFIISLSDKISLDQKLYEMLDKDYETNLDYVETYFDYFKPYIYLNGEAYQQINKMIVYTDNPSVLNSGSIYRMDYLDEEWLENIIKSPERLHIIYGESKKKSDGTIITPISIIRILNEFQGIDRYLKVIRIDLYAENIIKIINSETNKKKVFIFDASGSILFSNNITSNGHTVFLETAVNGQGFEYNKHIIQKKINGSLNWMLINVLDVDNIKRALARPRNNIILLTLLSLLLSSLIIFFIYRSFYLRLNALSEHVSNLEQDFNKPYTGLQGRDEIGSLIRAYNRMVSKIKTLITDVYEARLEQSHIKLEKKQAEINALQSQINPHYLFNTLESIRMKSIEKKEIETGKIIKYLARSLRRMISFRQEWIDVQEELAYIKDFLKIQKYRFGDEFEYILDIEPETLDIKIPKLIIQPFVENACIYGVEGSEDSGEVYVKIDISGDKLICIVRDNGIGIKKDKLNFILKHIKDEDIQGNSIGINNIYQRLNLYYGDDFVLHIESKEGIGTMVKLIIPVGVKDVQGYDCR